MASIPNLNTLFPSRRGTRLRARRGGSATGQDQSGSSFGEHNESDTVRDQVVQKTDHDASSSRMSAIAMGYLDDPFAQTFYPAGEQIAKRYPIINRGTYVRSRAIDRLVQRFLQADPSQQKQIISLGAGSDTRFFRLCAGQHNAIYHEIDFEANVVPKRFAIRGSSQLSRMILPREDGGRYYLHALDLRDLTKKSPPIIPGLEADLPTLIISECCLCYLPPDTANSVLQYFSMNVRADSIALILYEPIRPFDAFGQTMVSNLASRGIHLQTLKQYFSLETQRRRLRLAGFTSGQGARDVHQMWMEDDWVSASERDRIEKLEWLDEVEEWKLLASHYCVAWGWKGEVFDAAWSKIDGAPTSGESKNDMQI